MASGIVRGRVRTTATATAVMLQIIGTLCICDDDGKDDARGVATCTQIRNCVPENNNKK